MGISAFLFRIMLCNSESGGSGRAGITENFKTGGIVLLVQLLDNISRSAYTMF